MPDLYFYRDPKKIEKEEQAAAEKAVTKEEFQGEWTAPAPEFTAAQPEVADWSESVQSAALGVCGSQKYNCPIYCILFRNSGVGIRMAATVIPLIHVQSSLYPLSPEKGHTGKEGLTNEFLTNLIQELVSFEDVTVHFTEEEWDLLDSLQRTLYRKVHEASC
ncbi:hypothetical protein STEG23_018827 [Scotinomys teguina]